VAEAVDLTPPAVFLAGPQHMVSRFRVYGSGFRVQGLAFRVKDRKVTANYPRGAC
jgi:hypothetical protein